MRRGPSAEQLEQYRELKRQLHEEQGGKCAGCGRPLSLQLAACDLVHRTPLGMGRSRWNFEHPLNQPANVCLMHRPCHEEQEAEAREEHRRWRDDY